MLIHAIFVQISKKMNGNHLIPTERIIERLRYENPWWTNGRIPDLFAKMQKRLYFENFYPIIRETQVNRAIVLMGPRRVGKTVLLYHCIQQLLEDGVDPQNLFFIGIDNPIYIHLSLEDILNLCRNSVKKQDLNGCFIFFDEIQYLKDWERHLKILVDSYPNTKFIVSGSAAAALKWHSQESGAGRFSDFMLPPVTFKEFLHLKKLNHLVKEELVTITGKKTSLLIPYDIKIINKEFLKYLNFGGYPEVILSETVQLDMGRYIKNDIVDKVLLRDLPSLYGIKDVQELNRFFTYISYNTGNEFSYEKMSIDSGIPKETLKKFLDYLEAAYLIKLLYKVDINAKRLKRVTAFKVYLTNPSLRTALFSPVVETDSEMGNLVETALLSHWILDSGNNISYARWKEGRTEGEVDIVEVDNKSFKPISAIEIKWSNRYFDKPQELKSLMQFCKTNEIEHPLVTTIDQYGAKQLNKTNISFLPAAVLCLNEDRFQFR